MRFFRVRELVAEDNAVIFGGFAELPGGVGRKQAVIYVVKVVQFKGYHVLSRRHRQDAVAYLPVDITAVAAFFAVRRGSKNLFQSQRRYYIAKLPLGFFYVAMRIAVQLMQNRLAVTSVGVFESRIFVQRLHVRVFGAHELSLPPLPY